MVSSLQVDRTSGRFSQAKLISVDMELRRSSRGQRCHQSAQPPKETRSSFSGLFSFAFVIACSLVSGQVLQAESRTPKAPEIISVDAVLKEMRDLETLPQGEVFRELAKQPVIVFARKFFELEMILDSREDAAALLVELEIVNQSTDPLRFSAHDIRLSSGGLTLICGQLPPGISSHDNVSYDTASYREFFSYRTITPLTPISVEPNQALRMWCVFYGSPFTAPEHDLILSLKSQQRDVEINLNQQRNAELGLSVEWVGPNKVLALVKLAGELDVLNCRLLAKTLQEISDGGTLRCLVQVRNYGNWLSTEMVNWMFTSGDAPEDSLEGGMLISIKLPRFLLFGICSDDDFKNYPGPKFLTDKQRTTFFNVQDGADEFLGDVYENSSASLILSEIQNGHPLSSYVALKRGARLLSEDHFSFLKSTSHTENRLLRRAAYVALSHQQQGMAYLMELLNSKTAEVELDVLSAVLQSGNGSAIRQVHDFFLASKSTAKVDQIVLILQENWRSLFMGYVRRILSSDSALDRLSALELLKNVGAPDLAEIAIAAIHDTDPAVRSVAFTILSGSNSSRMSTEVQEYIHNRLVSGEIDDELLSILLKSQVPDACSLLLTHWGKPDFQETSRTKMATVICRDATEEQILFLVKSIETFPDLALKELADAIHRLPLKSQFDSSRVLIEYVMGLSERRIEVSEKSIVLNTVIKNLNRIDNQASRDFVRECVADYGLAGNPSQDASPTVEFENLPMSLLIEIYRKGADEKNFELLKLIDQEFQNRTANSNGVNFLVQGNLYIAREKLEEAIPFFSTAILVNPDLAAAYASRGNSYLRLEKFDLARQDFQKTFELNPLDETGVTGLALVDAIEGNFEQAIQRINDNEKYFTNHVYFPYNTACVYSRRIEYLRNQPSTPEKEAECLLRTEQALAALEVAFARGFDQVQWMQVDPDLMPIRTVPRFIELVEQGRVTGSDGE